MNRQVYIEASRDWTPTMVRAACVLLGLSLQDVKCKLSERMDEAAFETFMAGRSPTRSERLSLEIILGDFLGKTAIIKAPKDGEIGYFGVVALTETFKPGTSTLDLEKLAAKNRGDT
tara:strand:- start:684 stop:1034 length:351 start_codon:yes stop_codon:yes gene_type:complete